MSQSLNAARRQNQDALHGKNVTISDLDGFQLPVDVTEEFLTRMQKEVDILDRVTTTTLPRMEWQVPKFGVPRLSGNTRDEEGSRTSSTDAESGEFYFNVTDKNYYVLFEPNRDALKNTHLGIDNFGDLIFNEFVQRWANDVAIIGVRANADADGDGTGNLQNSFDEVTTSDLDDTWNGWIARAEGQQGELEDSTTDDRLGLEDTSDTTVMPSIDMTGDPIDTPMFNEGIQTLDERFRDTDSTVFLMNPNQVQQYASDLTQREDPLGAAVIFGDSDLTPFSYDIVGINEWPTEYAMFTDPENLAYGLFAGNDADGGMELDQTTDTDEVYENRLHSRNWLEGQFDFQIRDLQGGVLVENIADPLA